MIRTFDIKEITNNVSDIAENLQWEVAKAFPTAEFKELLINMLPSDIKDQLGDNPDFLDIDWSEVEDYGNLYDDYLWSDCVDWAAYYNAPIYHIIIEDDHLDMDSDLTDIMVHAKDADMVHKFAYIVEEVLSVHYCEDDSRNRV